MSGAEGPWQCLLTLLCPRSSEEAEQNLRNASEDEARPTGILIK